MVAKVGKLLALGNHNGQLESEPDQCVRQIGGSECEVEVVNVIGV